MDLGDESDFAALETDLQKANGEYLESLRIAGEPALLSLKSSAIADMRSVDTLHDEIKKAMRNILGQRQTQPTYVPPAAGYSFTLSL